jgi:hypothetical protein
MLMMLSQHRGLGIRTPSCTEIRKAKIVHVVAIGGAESFSCGVRIGDDFEKISGSQFLDLRKCKRCAQAKPIKTVGQFASALEKLRKA